MRPTKTNDPSTQPQPWPPLADWKPGPIWPELRRDGTLVRPFTTADAPALFRAIDDSRDTLLPWLPWAAKGHRSLDDTAQWIASTRATLDNPAAMTSADLGVFDEAGTLLGGVGVHSFIHDAAALEIGYWLATHARGRGVTTRATAALVTACFAPASEGGWEARRITIACSAANLASAAVARRLGFEHEATLRACYPVAGVGVTNRLIFARCTESAT